MSPRMRHICYFLDYGALSLYSLVSWSWKALGSVRSSAQEPSPIHSCSTTSHSFIGSGCAGAGATAVGRRP
nr:progestin and adipoQ receptor family member VI variant 3 [Homo sapiens]